MMAKIEQVPWATWLYASPVIWGVHMQVQFKDDTVLRHDGQNLTVKDFGVTRELLQGLRTHGV